MKIQDYIILLDDIQCHLHELSASSQDVFYTRYQPWANRVLIKIQQAYNKRQITLKEYHHLLGQLARTTTLVYTTCDKEINKT